MPLLIAEARKLSNNQLIAGIVEEIVDVDDTFSLLPFVQTTGKAYVYNREATLADAQFILPSLNVPESATSFTEVSVTLRILIGDVDVDNFINTTMSDTNSQRAVQIAHKAKAVARKFAATFIEGDTTKTFDLTALGGGASVANVEFDGLDRLCPAGQIVANGTNGAVLSYDKLDELIDTVKLGPDAFVMSRRTIRDFKKLNRALSNVDPDFITLDNGSRIMAYAGIPILMNDFVLDTKTVGTATGICSTVYAVRMNETDGLHGVYGGDTAGFTVVDIGQLEGKDSSRTRIRWYCALALKATHSIGKLVGVKAS